MSIKIEEYLKKLQEELEQSPVPTARFGLPAVQRLLLSKALQEQDWPAFERLIIRSIAVNSAEAALAEEFGDIFHPNVTISRREENGVYYNVLKILAVEQELERQSPTTVNASGSSAPTAPQ